MKRKILMVLAVVGLLIGSFGCAKTWDAADAKGGLFTSHKAPYIVVNQSGGIIMDVYKLESAIIQSPQGSDGWLFKDQEGNPVYLGGDVKTIRLKSTNSPLWDKYHEYHMEFENRTYRELYGEK